MVEFTPVTATVVLLSALLVAILLGFPLVFSLGGVAVIVGFLAYGPGVPTLLYSRIFGVVTDYVFLAVPLFVFMGIMIEQSGIAERLYSAFYVWLGGLPGGLAIISIMLGTIMAATVGVVTASVVMIGLIALPAMIGRSYSKEIACGSVCAGGTLGILIPPSIMLVVYGPTAGLSVGQLFMAAFIPGFVLSALYITYVGIRCFLQPRLGPPMPAEERTASLTAKIRLLISSVIPTLALILGVLGSIFFGIATPTEAAAVGALLSVLLSAAYRVLNFTSLKKAMYETLRVTALVMGIAIGGTMFTGIFMGLGGGDVITELILGMPGGRWGSFAVIMFIIFILGMFIDWVGIIFIMVPLITPMAAVFGFDPIWFAMMVVVNLQMSFMTPPFAPTAFVLQGIVRKEWRIDLSTIVRGVIPFVGIIMIVLALCVAFPQIILWLPSVMIR